MRQRSPHNRRPKRTREVPPEPIRIPKTIIEELLRDGHIRFEPESRLLEFFGVIVRLPKEQVPRAAVLWDNLLKGNAPIPQENVMTTGGRRGSDVRDAFKRTKLLAILIRDGCGNVWFRFPEEILKRAREAMPYRLLDEIGRPSTDAPPSKP